MNQMVSFFDRLKEERAKVGLSQTAFGEVGGVTKKTQMLYESGERAPDLKYLQRLADIGVDIQYVVTGKRAATSDHLDELLLEQSIEKAENLMRVAGKKYTAAQKAKIIGLVYQIYLEENTLSDDSLGRILRLVS
jgi:transcriptional regulator with XRE-family HTH domain